MSQYRFKRTELLYGEEGFIKINNAQILIAGLGGVGYMAAESLIRSGVHKIIIVDCDIVEETDFNRHILATEEDLSKSKVLCAKKRLLNINPLIDIDAIDNFIHSNSLTIEKNLKNT